MSSFDSHVVDAIDNALTDYNLSDDAMRWTPEEHPVPLGYRIVTIEIDTTRFTESFTRFARAYRQACEVVAAKWVPLLLRLARALQPPPDPHHPPPLCIDGRAYHQRRKNRRRRR